MNCVQNIVKILWIKFFDVEDAKSVKYFSHIFWQQKNYKETSGLYIISNFSIVAKLSPVVASMELSWLYSALFRPPGRQVVKVLSSLNSVLTSKAKVIVLLVRP